KDEFINFISSDPTAGDLITNSGGARKVRWKSKKRR
ncbi:MAG: addiction module toxin RelE, partial [SAR86 cluster bacterium]